MRATADDAQAGFAVIERMKQQFRTLETCLLYTSDAADERSSVDLGGRRIIKKNIYTDTTGIR